MIPGLISLLEKPYSYLPNFSTEIKEFTVKILPGFTLVFGLLIGLASIFDFLGSAFTSSFTLGGGGPQLVQQLLVRSVLGIIQGVIMFFAVKPLNRRHKAGWNLLFLSQILWIVGAAVSLNTSVVLGLLILYPLFQVRKYYN